MRSLQRCLHELILASDQSCLSTEVRVILRARVSEMKVISKTDKVPLYFLEQKDYLRLVSIISASYPPER